MTKLKLQEEVVIMRIPDKTVELIIKEDDSYYYTDMGTQIDKKTDRIVGSRFKAVHKDDAINAYKRIKSTAKKLRDYNEDINNDKMVIINEIKNFDFMKLSLKQLENMKKDLQC